MKSDEKITLSLKNTFKILFCACMLFTVTAGGGVGRCLAAGAESLSVAGLRAKRNTLRRDELEERKRNETRKWAAARQKGVVFVKTIKKSGELDKRIDVVIFADGFKKSEMRKFSSNASRTALQLLQTYPYSDYKNFFNFHVIGVASRDSGITTPGRPKDTAFASRLRERSMLVADLQRLVHYGELSPDMDLGIVLVNTTMREARSTAAGPFVTLRLGGEFGRTVAHELGHAFGNLADEYVEFKGVDPNRSEPSRINVTAKGDPKKVKWRYWVRATRGAVNVYEGANLFEKGYYRPEKECLMRTGKKFCRVCLEQMIRRMYESVPPIDEAYPTEYVVEMTKAERRKFAVRVNKTRTAPVLVEWYVDGVSKRKNWDEYTFDASRFKAGEHEVMVRAVCRNRNVLRDQGLLESSMFWKVRVLPHGYPVLDVTSAPLSAKVGKRFTYKVKGKSGASNGTLAYKTTLAPEGLAIDAETGELAWTPRESQVGVHLVRIVADGGAHSAAASLVITVGISDAPRNRPPVIEHVPIQDVVEGELIEFDVQARDLDDHGVVYYLEDIPEGAEFDGHTGRFHWRPGFSQVGQYELEFRAWDGLAFDKYKVPVIVQDVLFGALDMAAVEREVSRGDEDAFFGVFYALRCKNAGVRRRGIAMLKQKGAKSSVVELNRLLRDKDESVAMSAADALLDVVKNRLGKDDKKYLALLLGDILRTYRQMEDHKDRLEKLEEIIAAVAEKSADGGVTGAAEALMIKVKKLAK